MPGTKKSFLFGYSQVVNWLLAWVFLGFVNSSGLNIYRNAICDYYQISPVPILNGSTIAGIVGAFIFLAIPIVTRKIGAKWLLAISAIICGLAWAMGPMFSNPVLIAICMGIVNVTCNMFALSGTMVLVSKWFPRKKGTIMGIVTSGGLGAGLILVPLFNILNGNFDVKVASLVTGLLLVAYGVSSIFWLRETPQEVGLLPDNKPVDAELEKIMATQKGGWSAKEMLRCKKWWLSSVGWSATMFAIIGFITIAVTYMISRGVPQPMAMAAVSVCGIVQFVSSNIAGVIDQKIGPVKTSLLVNGCQIIGFLIVCFYGGASSGIVILSYLLVLGVFGATNNMFSSQILSLSGPKNYVTAFAGFTFIHNFSKAFAAYASSYSLTATGGYELAYKIFLATMVVGLILIVAAGDKLAPEALAASEKEEN